MPTLNWINFSVALDKSGATPVLRVVDTSVRPGAVTSITGTITVTQPDGITMPMGDTVTIPHTATPYSMALRLAGDGNFQKGNYTITLNLFTIVGGPDSQGSCTKTFTLEYEKLTVVLSPAINQFLPSVKVYDNTVYDKTGFTKISTSRTWNAQIEGVTNAAAAVTPIFDTVYLTNYYDAKYNVTASIIQQYAIVAAGYVTIVDKVTGFVSFDVWPAIGLSTLLQRINDYYYELTAANATNCKHCACDSKLNDIWWLFGMFRENGLCNYLQNQYNIYDQLLALLGIENTTHSFAPLAAYDFNAYCGYNNGVPAPLRLDTPVLGVTGYASNYVNLSSNLVTNAVSYITEWSLVADFSTLAGSVTTYHPVVGYAVLGLNPDTMYYFRRKAVASGYLDSYWGENFQRTTPAMVEGTLYHFTRANQIGPTEAEILAGVEVTFIQGANPITVDQRASSGIATVYGFAVRSTEGSFTRWFESLINQGAIHPSDLWYFRGSVASVSGAPWDVYYTSYPTLFTMAQQPMTFIH